MKRVFLSLGSNLGDREAHLRTAIEQLRDPAFCVRRISPVYETAPQGLAAQAWFLNLALEAETTLFPMQLLGRCQRIERSLKRQRSVPNGPRTIDIDLLFFGNAVIRSSRLEVPHPRYAERRFVLEPLLALDPELRDPATRRPIKELLPRVSGQSVRLTAIAIPAEPLS